MKKPKHVIYKTARIIFFLLEVVGILGIILSFLSDAEGYLTKERTTALLIISIIAWVVLNILLIFFRPIVAGDETSVWRVSKIKLKYQLAFLSIIIVLGCYLFLGFKNEYKKVVLKGETFKKEDTTFLRVIILPFRPDIKSSRIIVDYTAQIKEYLETVKSNDAYTFKIIFPKLDSADIPVTEEEAIKIGESRQADLVIWGSFEERGEQPLGLRVRYVLTKNYHGVIDPGKKKGDTEMKGLNTLSQLRQGYLLDNVEYILNWTEGISAYQKYNFDRAIKYFEKAKNNISAEEYSASTNILLANIHKEIGKDSLAYQYCLKALNIQYKHNDTTSAFFAYLLICCGATADRFVKIDSAFYFVRKGIHLLDSTPLKDSLYLGLGYIELGRLYYDIGRPNEAFPEYEKALSYLNSTKIDHILAIINLYYNMGIIRADGQRSDEALSLFGKALQFQGYLKHPDIILNSYIFMGLGNAYSQKGMFDSSIKYFRLAEHIFSSSLNNYLRISGLYSNIGNLYTNFSKYDSAKKYMEQSKRMLEDNGDTISMVYANVNVNLSEILKKKGSLPEALALEKKAERIFLLLTDSNFYFLGVVYINIAGITCEMNNITMADKYLLNAHRIFLNTSLNNKDKSAYYPSDPNLGYYYWVKAKIEQKKGDILNAKNNANKAMKIFSVNYSTDYKDFIELKEFTEHL